MDALTASSARSAGLRYVNDQAPGIRREAVGDQFIYRHPNGRRVLSAAVIRRIEALAIPPAYTDVWISTDREGHLQATARDQRRRKQYFYHPQWRVLRDASKFERLARFGAALPTIRRRIQSDLRMPGLSRRKVIAAIVRLLETTSIRIGNEEYARENRSYGLTTLRNRHIDIVGPRMRFAFRGKSGVKHRIEVDDAVVARVVRNCMEIPGQELFQYLDNDGVRHPIGSSDVNAYLREVTEADYTAKDYRTWAASVAAVKALDELAQQQPDASISQRKRDVAAVIREVAGQLGNTPTVCRQCYVHPRVVEAYLQGALPVRSQLIACRGLNRDERLLLTFLKTVDAH